MNLCVYTCFVYLQSFCVTLDFKLFIDSIYILFLLYLLLWFWDFTIKNLQDFIKVYRALIKDIFLYVEMVLVPPLQTLLHPPFLFKWEGQGELVQSQAVLKYTALITKNFKLRLSQEWQA